MTRKMFDSTTAADVPDGSPLVMGYVDGTSAWSDADWQRFSGRTLVGLCIFNDRMDAQVIDIEPRNNDAKGAVPWIRAKWERGETPTVYCFTDAGPVGYRISDVRSECDLAGVKRPLILLTDFDNDPGTFDPIADPEIIGKQYANAALTGGHYDVSVVADFWPGVDKEGPVADLPQYAGQTAETIMLKVNEVGVLEGAWVWPNGTRRAQTEKVVFRSPGRRPYTMYPKVDPDADETRELSADPALFIVDVIA